MKNSRFQFEYKKNASKLHKAVGEVLRNSDVFNGHETYQEYPVNKVNTDYAFGSHHFDWVIPKLRLVIECHGKQHYQAVTFGGVDVEKAIENFKEGQKRDQLKKEAALAADYLYVVVPYTKEKTVDSDFIYEQMKLAEEELAQYNEIKAQEKAQLEEEAKKDELDTVAEQFAEKQKEQAKTARQRYLSSTFHKEQLKRAREFRKKRYRELKDKFNG